MTQVARNYYKRNLPHWHPFGRSFFLTWRLAGSLPQTVINEMRIARQRLRQQIGNPERCNDVRMLEYKKLFARVDSILDSAATGPTWLSNKEIAGLVQQTLLEQYAHLYILWSFVVMANHVHTFLKPKRNASVEVITQRIKGYTAFEANRILGRKGKFWQDESFDHWARDEREFARIVAYIENNPVKAGLVTRPEDWPWSSAAERKRRGWKEFRALT